jgi:hypothetical protein
MSQKQASKEGWLAIKSKKKQSEKKRPTFAVWSSLSPDCAFGL